MIESDAKSKWCPMARCSQSGMPETGNHASNVFPKGSTGFTETRCIASDCMLWKWDKHAGTSTLSSMNGATIRTETIAESEGHCGLVNN